MYVMGEVGEAEAVEYAMTHFGEVTDGTLHDAYLDLGKGCLWVGFETDRDGPDGPGPCSC